ncbi:MAG: AraC family transcriptional regulator [Puniceicoccaceae bacterium 5H]|nr:MAG: AraC family transcriptional regulator [Puniceicoccaceae bacterium 5H]
MASHYELMGRALCRLADPDAEELSMEDLGAALGLSRAHFQRLFSQYVGISPHRYRQFVQLERAKGTLRAGGSVLDAALNSGFSGPSRLHDALVQFESMTPGEFKRGGLLLRWGVHGSIFGPYLLALSPRGISALYFYPTAAEAAEKGRLDLLRQYPGAVLEHDLKATTPVAERLFQRNDWATDANLNLYVRGTNFQVQVWRALLRIPGGTCVTYQQVADAIERPTAARAVGQAVGTNPVSWLIPCHRVLRSDGGLSGYRWGSDRKQRLLAWELAQNKSASPTEEAGTDEPFAKESVLRR